MEWMGKSSIFFYSATQAFFYNPAQIETDKTREKHTTSLATKLYTAKLTRI